MCVCNYISCNYTSCNYIDLLTVTEALAAILAERWNLNTVSCSPAVCFRVQPPMAMSCQMNKQSIHHYHYITQRIMIICSSSLLKCNTINF